MKPKTNLTTSVDSKEWKEIQLTQGYLTKVDADDYEKFSHLKWSIRKIRDLTRVIMSNKNINKSKVTYLSREIMGNPKGKVVDHINGDTLDNRKVNLRICDHKDNLRNQKKSKNNKSGYKGVYKARNKWRAEIKDENIGTYNTKEEAALAYNQKAKKIFGEFARLNEIITPSKGTK